MLHHIPPSGDEDNLDDKDLEAESLKKREGSPFTLPNNWKESDVAPCSAVDAVREICDPSVASISNVEKRRELTEMIKTWVAYETADGTDLASTSLSQLLSMGPCKYYACP